MIRWQLHRWRPMGVRPVELWDLPFRGGLIYQRLGAAFAGEAARRGTSEAALDAELAAAVAHLCELAAPRVPVWIAGGLAARPGLAAAVARYELTRVMFASEP